MSLPTGSNVWIVLMPDGHIGDLSRRRARSSGRLRRRTIHSTTQSSSLRPSPSDFAAWVLAEFALQLGGWPHGGPNPKRLRVLRRGPDQQHDSGLASPRDWRRLDNPRAAGA